MALKLPDMSAFKAVPMGQKVALLALLLGGIGAGFYYMIEEPQQGVLTQLRTEIGKLDTEINTNKEKIKNLEQLKKLNAELEKQLAKNQDQLPPEEEAATLLKQLSDLGIRIGLDLKLWKPNPR